MGPRPEMQVSRQNCPAALLAEGRDPLYIRRILGELIPQSHDVMLGLEQSIQ